MKNSEIHAVHSHHRRPQRKKTPLWKKLFMALVVIMVICVAGAGAGFLLSIAGTQKRILRNSYTTVFIK